MAVVLSWTGVASAIGIGLLMFWDAEHTFRSMVFFLVIIAGLIVGFAHRAYLREHGAAK